MNFSRRDLLKASTAAMGVSLTVFAQEQHLEPVRSPDDSSSLQIARDEKFWRTVAAQFEFDRSFINLENGYYGIMPVAIYTNYLRNTLRLNRLNSYLLRTIYKEEIDLVRRRLAEVLHVSSDELALTRGGTEALQNLIVGYNKLEPGDEVMYADLDYYSCQYAFKWLEKRRGVSLIKISIPEPAEKQAVLDTYEQALNEHPRLKLLLLTHLNNRTGLVLPVADISDMARQRGVDVIVDAAHSWGQLDFNIEDLKSDFIGLSFHKWIHAPLGLGCLYIRKDRISDIDPSYGDEIYDSMDIRSRVHSGTTNIAPFLTLPAALDFHLSLGAEVKQERLRYLRNYWVSRVKHLDMVQILTPDEPQMHGGITSFRIRGRQSKHENEEIVRYLFERHGIFTVRKGGIQNGDCVRVTPALFTKVEDVERLAVAIEDTARKF